MRIDRNLFARLLWGAFVFLTVPALSLAQSNTAAPRITQAINSSQMVILQGNTHPLARPAYDRGPAPSDLPMQHMLLLLKRSPQQEAALDKLLAEQQDKKSPNYHQWLTPEEFGEQFGPSEQDIQTVRSWLQSQGFTVNEVTNGRTVIDFSGNASQVQSAFHTTIHRYVLPNGEQHWANSSDPQIPAALASVVGGIRSLHNFFPKPAHHVAPHPAFTYSFQNCNPTANDCFDVGPADFAKIYNVPATISGAPAGTGQTIAIVSDSDINYTVDLAQFRSMFGLSAMNMTTNPSTCVAGTPCFVQFVPPTSTDPGIQCPDPTYAPAGCDSATSDGDETEAILDTEWAGAPAPAANLWLVSSADTTTSFGGDLSATYIVNCPTTGANCPTAVPASVLSSSYGNCEFVLGTSGNQFYNSTWQQAAAEGITVVVATGDDGSAGCDEFIPSDGTPQPAEGGLAVSGTASTPYNVAVGGTDFDEAQNPTQFWSLSNTGTESALGYIPETTWNDSCTNAILGTSAFGGSSSPQANCNNEGFVGFVFTLGASGGPSTCTTSDFNPNTGSGEQTSCADPYPKPSWQAGSGVPNDGARDLPDISLFASNEFLGSGYIMCEEDSLPQAQVACSLTSEPPNPNSEFASFTEVGGTSVSVQAFAGIVSLIDQQTGFRQGLINPTLYSLAGQSGNTCASAANPASTCVFYDVTSGTISQPCDISFPGFSPSTNCTGSGNDEIGVLELNGQLAYNAGTGYDLATGLGSVNVGNLVSKWPATAGFLLSSTDPFVTLASASSSGSLSFSIISQNGFSGSINGTVTCSNLPSNFSCGTFTPSSMSLAAGATVTATLAIAPSSSGMSVPARAPRAPSGPMTEILILLLCGSFLGLLLVGAWRSPRLSRAALVAVFFVCLAAAFGCGGGGSSSGSGSSGGNGTGGSSSETATVTVTVGGQSQTMNFTVTAQ
jgi:subtilase family serine protease